MYPAPKVMSRFLWRRKCRTAPIIMVVANNDIKGLGSLLSSSRATLRAPPSAPPRACEEATLCFGGPRSEAPPPAKIGLPSAGRLCNPHYIGTKLVLWHLNSVSGLLHGSGKMIGQ